MHEKMLRLGFSIGQINRSAASCGDRTGALAKRACLDSGSGRLSTSRPLRRERYPVQGNKTLRN